MAKLAQAGGGSIMDVKSAAIQVLQQVGMALHAKEITERIMAAGL